MRAFSLVASRNPDRAGSIETTIHEALRLHCSKTGATPEAAAQRARRSLTQVSLLKSITRSPVVFASIVTGFTGGGGGALTLSHSSMMVCAASGDDTRVDFHPRTALTPTADVDVAATDRREHRVEVDLVVKAFVVLVEHLPDGDLALFRHALPHWSWTR